jgi:hypothetical protein
MSDLRRSRQSLVRTLRKAAKNCGVPPEELPTDRAGKDKVELLANRVAASGGPAEHLAAAAEAWDAYAATWPLEDSEASGLEDEEQPLQRVTFRFRGKSFLLTYNWDFFW